MYVDHAEKPDIALELPTGTGKTITGHTPARQSPGTTDASEPFSFVIPGSTP